MRRREPNHPPWARSHSSILVNCQSDFRSAVSVRRSHVLFLGEVICETHGNPCKPAHQVDDCAGRRGSRSCKSRGRTWGVRERCGTRSIARAWAHCEARGDDPSHDTWRTPVGSPDHWDRGDDGTCCTPLSRSRAGLPPCSRGRKRKSSLSEGRNPHEAHDNLRRLDAPWVRWSVPLRGSSRSRAQLWACVPRLHDKTCSYRVLGW
jgi:hypothetical protein